MNVTQNVGAFLFIVGGSLVLAFYAINWSSISKVGSEFRKKQIQFRLWAASGVAAAISYLLLLGLWLQWTHIDPEAADLFVTGLAVFVLGACTWPWVLTKKNAERAAVGTTAVGSILILAASSLEPDMAMYAVIPASYLAFHHVFVDGIWWLLLYKRKRENDALINALYILYYAPLFAALVLFFINDWYSTTAAVTVIVITALHFIAGMFLVVRKPSLQIVFERYKDPNNSVADAVLTVALAVACIGLSERKYVYPALAAAIFGNIFCSAGQAKYDLGMRVQWMAVLTVWGWLAVVSKLASWTVSTVVAAIVFGLSLWSATKPKAGQLDFSHNLAGVFHSASSLALSIVTLSERIDWRAPLTRYISSWDHPASMQKTEVDCSKFPCFLSIDIKHMPLELPLVDLVVAASCISATYHIYIAYSLRKGGGRRILEARWHDYSLSAPALVVVIAALCGVSDVFILLLIPSIMFILLNETIELERRFEATKFVLFVFLYMVSWSPSLYQFLSSYENEPRPPDVIIVIIVVLFVLYSAFIFNFLTVIRTDEGATKISDAERRQEQRYILLSFLAKTILHWLLYTGIRGRQDRVFLSEEEAVTAGSNSDPDTLGLSLSILVPVCFGVVGYLVSKRWTKTKPIYG